MPTWLARGLRWKMLLFSPVVWLAGTLLIGYSVLSGAAQAQVMPTAQPSGFQSSGQPSSVRGTVADIFSELDRFWTRQFEEASLLYRSPAIVQVTSPLSTVCGQLWPEIENAMYCPDNSTIYLFPLWLDEERKTVGDYAPVTIVAHEWGHHIQHILGIPDADSKAFETQADCLSGAFTAQADDAGLLDVGDFLEAIDLTIDFGDDALGLPLDNPNAHGTSEERIKSLMKGYGGGPFVGCELPMESSQSEAKTPTPPIDPTKTVEESGLPDTLPLAHTTCFRIESDGQYSLDELVARLGGTEDARDHLLSWHWITSTYRTFACDTPPVGDAGWVDISISRFMSAAVSQEAVDYFAAKRAEGTSLMARDSPHIGDYAVALAGPASNGREFTIYASQGPMLIRVTGVSPTGFPPFGNVLTVARSVLEAQQSEVQTVPPPEALPQAPSLPASAYLPAHPAVNYADCFQVASSGAYDYADVLDALSPTGMTASQFATLGWQDGAYVAFTCDEPPFGRAAEIDVGIQQFQDAEAAQQALPYYSAMYVLGEHEYRSCDAASARLICVSGRSLTGSPLSDVHFVLNQVISAAR